MTRQKPTSMGLLVLVLLLSLGVNALASSTWYVNGVSGSDSNNCASPASACRTIGHAISRSASGDSILVAAATYNENLSIALSLTIVGASAPTTIIDGGGKATVVTIRTAGAHVNLSQLTIRNGSGLTHGGGGIYNAGTLTLTSTTVSGSSSSYGGGGIYNAGTLAMTKTTVSGNSTNDFVNALGGLGGGIYNSGTLTVTQSTVNANNVSRARISDSPAGAGIYNTRRLTITNSTLSGNQAADHWPAGPPFGGGLANENGTAMIYNSTISLNAAIYHTPNGTFGAFGGGIYNKSTTAPTLQNSIVANNTGNTGEANCYGNVTSHGFNMSSDSSCTFNGPGDQKNINPDLGLLTNNGGATHTMALLAGSPARSAGNPSGCTDSSGHRLTIDQRGDPRPGLKACDMGAYNH